MKNLIIKNSEDIYSGASKLFEIEPKFLDAVAVCDLPKLRTQETGFEALFKIIVSQQLSVASAAAIWQKLVHNKFTLAKSVLEADENKLRKLGLSRTKISYAKNLASTELNYDSLSQKSNTEIINELTNIKGVGLWSAQIYLMFSLRRADIFAPGDLALQEGSRILFDITKRPAFSELDYLSRLWTPFRTIAAMIIWKYYMSVKNLREY